MYLSQVHIRNFRSCADTTVKLRPTITLIVGENNAGKSNVVDAIRLSVRPLSGRRSRYFEVDDLHRSASSSAIEIESTFSCPSSLQRGQFITALNMATNTVTYTVKFTPDPDGRRRGRVETFSGAGRGPDVEPEKRNELNHVYLEPLRDAKRELDSASGQRISQIIRYLTSGDDQESFVVAANSSLRELEKHTVIASTQSSLQSHLTDLTAAVRPHDVGLGFADYKLHRLARNLRLKLAEHEIDLADVSESGLGYSNLLYMATLILELRNAQDSELTLFLVEEPEAHLHPQLQAVMLDYLRDQAERSIKDDSLQRAGRIQIIATTHSPNLASAVGVENVVVLRSAVVQSTGLKSDETSHGDGEGESRESVADKSTPRPVTQTDALALADLPLSPVELRKIDQYLDVTRSELLFARKVLLVEGIAEAVLLPVLADQCIFRGDGEEERRKRRALRGCSIINIGSVDFAPYIKLMLQSVNGVRLVDQLVIVTDGDPALKTLDVSEKDDIEQVLDAEQSHGDVLPDSDAVSSVQTEGEDDRDDPEISDDVSMNRAAVLRDLILEIGASDIASVVEARFTLEADLMEPIEANAQVLRAAFLDQKPRSAKAWVALSTATSPAEAMYKKLRASKKFLGKGQFAHDVAYRLRTDDHEFKCPEYLADAIRIAAEL